MKTYIVDLQRLFSLQRAIVRNSLLCLAFGFCILCPVETVRGQGHEWIASGREAKPYTRWWWLGSAVDSSGLAYNMGEYARVGIGGVEITPIYGVQGGEARDIAYLSPRWMDMLGYVETLADRLGMEVNMSTGTGWPFGGPQVAPSDGACRLTWSDDGRPVVGRTGQKVKRAAPGGEGLVVDHFDRGAVARYLARFDTAFVRNARPFPSVMFNDSYEVYGADWTPRLLDEFMARRGYDLAPYLYIMNKADSLRDDGERRIMSDYRETLGELLLENFTTQWTLWAHGHGSLTRNQAHGSPANLIDVYGVVDIPECEGFGLSDFGIRGLRRDPGHTRTNDSDLSMLKYASSAAHVAGRRYVSAEAFTWLTEHFRTSLSQCKPDLDLLFLSGVNHVFFHGSCYSPPDAPWPGWRFYASVDMTPANNWWGAMPAFCKYIERCQTFLQWGSPDNDVLVYLPYYDMLYEQPGTVVLFDIHSMSRRAPRFIRSVQELIDSGYDVDYVSDRYLSVDSVTSRYAALVVPHVRFMPLPTLRRLLRVAEQGRTVVFVGDLPASVPGRGRGGDAEEFARLVAAIRESASGLSGETKVLHWGQGRIVLTPRCGDGLRASEARLEPMRTGQGLSYLRRANGEGYHYFVANLQDKDVDDYVALGVKARHVALYNPMDGSVGRAQTDAEGRVRLQLRSGESLIVRTWDSDPDETFAPYRYYPSVPSSVTSLEGWTLSFKEAAPIPISRTFRMEGAPRPWTALGDSLLNATMATGLYRSTVTLPRKSPRAVYVLNLGDVRETARVRVNGREAGVLFAVPFRIDLTDYLRKGTNTIEVEVANLPANRIAQMDREGIVWRKFKEINVVDINYKTALYGDWPVATSGLNGEVLLEEY